jgi:hypothetical protein
MAMVLVLSPQVEMTNKPLCRIMAMMVLSWQVEMTTPYSPDVEHNSYLEDYGDFGDVDL